jgi:hypothetical protein
MGSAAVWRQWPAVPAVPVWRQGPLRLSESGLRGQGRLSGFYLIPRGAGGS